MTTASTTMPRAVTCNDMELLGWLGRIMELVAKVSAPRLVFLTHPGGYWLVGLVGLVLDRHWTGRLAGGVRLYDFEAYRWGFSLMLAWGALSLVLLAFTRETYCRQAR